MGWIFGSDEPYPWMAPERRCIIPEEKQKLRFRMICGGALRTIRGLAGNFEVLAQNPFIG